MKKLFIAVIFSICPLALRAGVTVNTGATNTVLIATGSLQNLPAGKGIFVATGTIRNLNVSTLTVANVIVTSTFTNLTVTNLTATNATITNETVSVSTITSLFTSSGTSQAPSINLNNQGGLATVNTSSLRFLVKNGSTWQEMGSVDVNNFNLSTTTVLNSTFTANSGSNITANAGSIVQLNGTNSIKGTTTNDNAATGFVGEYVSSNVFTATNDGTTNVYTNLAQVSLTAGDWDVTGCVGFLAGGATVTGNDFAISVNSGNTTTDQHEPENQLELPLSSSASSSDGCIAAFRQSINATTIVYLKTAVVYTGGPNKVRGSLHARRVR